MLWVTENYPPSRGGMAQSCDRIVHGLRGRGLNLDIAHLSRSTTSTWSTTKQRGGLLLSVPLEDDPEHAMHRLWTALLPEHEREPFSHVVAFGGAWPIQAAPVYAAWLGADLITLLRGNDFDAGVFSLRRRASLLYALDRARIVGVVSTNNLPRVRSLVPGADVRVVPNGIDATEWTELPSERETALAWRHAHVREDRLTVGLVGQLKRKKGALFFLEAMASSGFADRFHVVLVGDIEDAVTSWLASDAAATSRLHWSELPFLDHYELLGVLPACDIVALPSFYDGLPNVALEAAALGIPLLASDAGGLADLVDERIGFCFPAGDTDGCRSAIGALAATSGEELAALGEAARSRVLNSFAATTEIDGYMSMLELA